MNLMEAIDLYENGDFDEGEALEIARLLVTSGLVNSRGEYGRFVQAVIIDNSPENFYMDGEL